MEEDEESEAEVCYLYSLPWVVNNLPRLAAAHAAYSGSCSLGVSLTFLWIRLCVVSTWSDLSYSASARLL